MENHQSLNKKRTEYWKCRCINRGIFSNEVQH